MDYDMSSIVSNIAWYDSVDSLKILVSIVGKKEFSKFMFIPDPVNATLLEVALRKNKVSMIKFIVSLDSVKTVYQSDNFWIYRLFWRYENGELKRFSEMFKNTLTDLGLTKEKVVVLLQNYRYVERKKNFELDRIAVKCFMTGCSMCIHFAETRYM